MAREKIVSEMKRVVKPNGTIIFLDFQVPLSKNMWALFARVIEFLVNGGHYHGFKDYLRSGGINNLINTNHLHGVDRFLLMSGLIIAVRVVGTRFNPGVIDPVI